MCIDMGIGIDSAKRVTVAKGVVWFMARAYKTKTRRWMAQVGGCWSVRL